MTKFIDLLKADAVKARRQFNRENHIHDFTWEAFLDHLDELNEDALLDLIEDLEEESINDARRRAGE